MEDNQRPNVSIISHSRETRNNNNNNDPVYGPNSKIEKKREEGKNVWLIGDSSLLAVKRYAILGFAG